MQLTPWDANPSSVMTAHRICASERGTRVDADKNDKRSHARALYEERRRIVTRHAVTHATWLSERTPILSISAMSGSINTGSTESYPGEGLSGLQLLYATRKELQNIISGGRCV